MVIYAGIDEAGYGPMFGPLVIGRFVFGAAGDDPTPDLWQQLAKAVCRDVKTARHGRIAVNDSKKLHTSRRGLRHLETGVLSFAALGGKRPENVCHWLDQLGEQTHHDLSALPWYQPDAQRPWAALPCSITPGELAVARSMLGHVAGDVGVQVMDLGASVVFEDRFNRMVAATRSKASASFTFVAGHLQHIWERFGEHHPTVIVDRQSGRTHYRSLLSLTFPDSRLTVLGENDAQSAYELHTDTSPPRAMTIRFEVEAERQHMPVALASMISKYTRELLMARLAAWFSYHAPTVKPTAGYALDARRFWEQIQPTLQRLQIEPGSLRRIN